MRLDVTLSALSALWALSIAVAGCSTTDDRPQTLAFITEAILAPSCGTAECHSAKNRQSGDVFDSVAGAQATIQNYGLVACTDAQNQPLNPCDDGGKTYLITVLTTTDVEGDRMPFDQPLANKDIVFIEEWITNGADGYVPNAAAR